MYCSTHKNNVEDISQHCELNYILKTLKLFRNSPTCAHYNNGLLFF